MRMHHLQRGPSIQCWPEHIPIRADVWNGTDRLKRMGSQQFSAEKDTEPLSSTPTRLTGLSVCVYPHSDVATSRLRHSAWQYGPARPAQPLWDQSRIRNPLIRQSRWCHRCCRSRRQKISVVRRNSPRPLPLARPGRQRGCREYREAGTHSKGVRRSCRQIIGHSRGEIDPEWHDHSHYRRSWPSLSERVCVSRRTRGRCPGVIQGAIPFVCTGTSRRTGQAWSSDIAYRYHADIAWFGGCENQRHAASRKERAEPCNQRPNHFLYEYAALLDGLVALEWPVCIS